MSLIHGVYMGTARLHAALSKARRKKVGAVLVTKQGVTLTGYNGTPSGWDNNCEFEDHDNLDEAGNPKLVTKPEVIHAELNCVLKAAKEGVSCVGSTIFVSLSPCVPCAAMLAQAGITRLIYDEEYRDQSGIECLRNNGVIVEKFSEDLK